MQLVPSGYRTIASYVVPMAIFLAFTSVESWLPLGWYPLAYAGKMLVVTASLLILRGPLSDIRPTGPVVAPSILVGLVVCGLWVGIEKLVPYPHLGSRVGFNPFETIAEPRWQYAFVLVRLAGLAVVVPVMEELFWRSFLLRYLTDEHFTAVPFARFSWRAFAIVAGLFATGHPEWLPAVLTACAYGLLVRRTGSIFGAVVAHATTNAALGAYILIARDWVFW